MARKIGRSKSHEDSKSAVEELDVLHPERRVELGGRSVVVREYGGVEWLRMLPSAAPVIDALAALLDAGQPPSYDAALAAIAGNIDTVLPMVAQAADLDMAALEALGPDDIDLLLMVWWGVNGRFFVSRAVNRVHVARAEARIAQSAGANSTPPSSPTATPSPTSAATPAAN